MNKHAHIFNNAHLFTGKYLIISNSHKNTVNTLSGECGKVIYTIIDSKNYLPVDNLKMQFDIPKQVTLLLNGEPSVDNLAYTNQNGEVILLAKSSELGMAMITSIVADEEMSGSNIYMRFV